MIRRLLWIAAASAAASQLVGCSSIVSPYGGEGSFNCAAQYEEGTPCESVSGTAVNYKAGALPWQNRDKSKTASGEQSMTAMQSTALQSPVSPSTAPATHSGPAREIISPRQQGTPVTGMPLRVPERVLRIWVAPFEDDDGALNDQKFIYVSVTRGQWQMEANRINQVNQYRQIFPLGRAAANEAEPVDQRAAARSEALGAVTHNPNIAGAQGFGSGGAPAMQPRDEE